MATVAMFTCMKVVSHGGGTWVPLCVAEQIVTQWPPQEEDLSSTRYGGHVEDECDRCVELAEQLNGMWSAHLPGKSSEQVELRAVSSGGDDDPNKAWAVATPAGTLEMTINNPLAWGSFQPGVDYRIEIRRRIPQNARE